MLNLDGSLKPGGDLTYFSFAREQQK